MATKPNTWEQHIPPESLEIAERIPASLRPHIDESIGYLFTPDVVERFTPEMATWDVTKVWGSLFKETALSKIRMEATVGSICAMTSDKHPRYPFFTYVPMKSHMNRIDPAPLIVTVHGSCRSAQFCRDRFVEFAEKNGCYVLSPMFPMNMADDDPDEQYKYVFTEKVRFDLVILDLIEEFSRLVGTKFGPIILHGYSGGGQFTHRFLYLHAHRLAAASIGAPGYVTLPDDKLAYPTGLGGLEALTGTAPNVEAIARIPLHLYVGADDNDPIDVYSLDELGLTQMAYEQYGSNRIQRLESLRDAYQALGANVTYDLVPGMGHVTKSVEPACRFFEQVLVRG
jgi:predicted esterase